MRVLGIDVPRSLVDVWRDWLAPPVQPFFVDSLCGWPQSVGGELTPELRDTYKTWRVDRALKVLWLDEETFASMPRAKRGELVRAQVSHRRGAVPTVRGWSDLVDATVTRAQADRHRFVWWPSLVDDRVLHRFVSALGLSSRHHEAPSPPALAGTFPAPGSRGNCFGTVMAAAGVDDVADEWMLREPFEEWLAKKCRRGGNNRDAGTVLVWRERSGLPFHAALTIGNGYVYEKPSQEWFTPRWVLTVEELIRYTRARGLRLERHRVAP